MIARTFAAAKLFDVFNSSTGEKSVRYIILSVLLLVVMSGQAIYGDWIYDFWEHSAVVKELSVNPLHPNHPLFLVDKPHAFASPYLEVVALLSRVTSLNPINSLAVSGIVNLLLFLVGFAVFLLFFK